MKSLFLLTLLFSTPAPHPDRPLLERLNQETIALYDQVEHCIVRVELPTPGGVAAEQVLKKYQNLNEPTKQIIEAGVKAAPEKPAPPPVEQIPSATSTYIFCAPSDADRDPITGGKLQSPTKADPGFAPNAVGILLPDGCVLVPYYMDRALFTRPIRAAGFDGRVISAEFAGSDRQTGLSVFRLKETVKDARPVELKPESPADGTLVMTINAQDGSGRLGLWTAGVENGVVFVTDGTMAGIARFGQFLSGESCKVIADQLARHGEVRRGRLGIVVSEVRRPDAKAASKRTGNSFLRIDRVLPDSPAEKAELAAGDVIVALGGRPVNDIPTFAAALASDESALEMTVSRNEQTRRCTLDLQAK